MALSVSHSTRHDPESPDYNSIFEIYGYTTYSFSVVESAKFYPPNGYQGIPYFVNTFTQTIPTESDFVKNDNFIDGWHSMAELVFAKDQGKMIIINNQVINNYVFDPCYSSWQPDSLGHVGPFTQGSAPSLYTRKLFLMSLAKLTN